MTSEDTRQNLLYTPQAIAERARTVRRLRRITTAVFAISAASTVGIALAIVCVPDLSMLARGILIGVAAAVLIGCVVASLGAARRANRKCKEIDAQMMPLQAQLREQLRAEKQKALQSAMAQTACAYRAENASDRDDA